MFKIKRKYSLTAALTAVCTALLLGGCGNLSGSEPPVNVFSVSQSGGESVSGSVSSSVKPAQSSEQTTSAPSPAPAQSSLPIQSTPPEPTASSPETESSSEEHVTPDPPPYEEPEALKILYHGDPAAPCEITFFKDHITVSGKKSSGFVSIGCEKNKGVITNESSGDDLSYTLYPNDAVLAGKYVLLYIEEANNSYYAKKFIRCRITDDGIMPAYVPETLEGNKAVMKNVSVLPAGKVLQYITLDGKADRAAAVLDEIKKLSDKICEGITDDYEKARAISYYVSEKLYYDKPAYNMGIPQECLSLEYMLNNRSSVCGGYSNLTSALCAAQGIKCYNIKGSGVTGSDGFILGLDGGFHEWNAAEINGRLINIDSGWNSNNTFRTDKTYETKDIIYKYFDLGTEFFAINHRAQSAEYRDYWGAIS